MKALKVFSVIVISLLLFCACSQNTPSESKDTNIDIANESQNVSDQIQQVVDSNSAVTVGEYAVPDAASFDTDTIDGGVTIRAYHGDLKAIEIPETINGEKVLAIESGAFTNAEVTGVRIPDTVIQIKEKAFYYCMTLIEVELGVGVQEIGYETFEGCLALKTVSLNQGLIKIGDMAFSNTPSLGAIDLPHSLESMGESVFVLSGISELTIPGNVKTIERQLCSTCSNLERVILEDGIEAVRNKAFEDCKNLKTIEIPLSVAEIEPLAFMYTEQVTIVAPAGSAAESFAKDAGIAFSAK